MQPLSGMPMTTLGEVNAGRCQHDAVWCTACSCEALGMKTLGDLRLLLLNWASTTVLLGQADAREVIRYAFAAVEVKWRIAGTIYSSNAPGARSARLSRFAKAISP